MRKKILVIIVIMFCLIIPTKVSGQNGDYESDDKPETENSIAFLILMCLLAISPLFFILYRLTLAIYTKTDAIKRGHNYILWSIIVFFTGLIGFIIYYLFRKPTIEKK